MPCCQNHPDRKSVARGLCDTCYKKWQRHTDPRYRKIHYESSLRWARRNPTKVAAIQQRYRQNNKEKIVEKNRRYRKQWREQHPDEYQERKIRDRIRKRYDLSLEQYDAFRESQKNCCAICGEKNRLIVDHNHKTTMLRGLLCTHCNSMIGFARENIAVLEKAIIYIREKNGS